MLARNFLPAEKLGLTDAGHTVLQQVLHMLETNELVWTTYNKPIRNGFNMATVFTAPFSEYRENPECGTAGCISGWAHLLLEGRDMFLAKETMKRKPEDNSAFLALTMPLGCHRGEHTVEQAAHALRTYLTTGTPEWEA